MTALSIITVEEIGALTWVSRALAVLVGPNDVQGAVAKQQTWQNEWIAQTCQTTPAKAEAEAMHVLIAGPKSGKALRASGRLPRHPADKPCSEHSHRRWPAFATPSKVKDRVLV